MSAVQQVTVGHDEAEQRLDRWFRKRWPHVGQGRIEKMCRKGEIRVDGARAKTSTRVAPGQIVRVPPLPDPDATPRSAPAEPVQATDLDLTELVVHQDEHLIVLNKPPGLAVQGGSKQSKHLGAYLHQVRGDKDADARLVHRLDRDTSGLIVLARTGAAATALGALFRTRAVEKIYYAAVAGRPNPRAGTIRYALVKAGGRGAERMELVHPDEVNATEGAVHARTDYMVIDQAASRMAWVALRPVTGRTHQLRAHMAGIGNPIAGDGKYGSRGQENLGDGWGAGLGGGLSRKLHLHAASLSFQHPMTKRAMIFRAPLPEHMLRSWDMLGWDPFMAPDDPFSDEM